MVILEIILEIMKHKGANSSWKQ